MLDKLSNRTMWWLMVPTAFLIFILGCVTGASLYLTWKTHHPHTNIAEIKLNATLNMVRNEMASDYNFLGQQQVEIQSTASQLKTLSGSMNKTQTPETNSATLSNAIANLQNQANQLNTQRQHLIMFNDTLTQFNADMKNKNN